MKNIHLSPTNKETRLYLSNYGKELNLASWKVIGTKEDTFYNGAKWQVKRMYSEEDMIEFAKWMYLEVGANSGKDRTNKELFNLWVIQNKKK